MFWSLCAECASRAVIKRLQVQVLAGVVGEFYSKELTFCADSHAVSIPPSVTALSSDDPMPSTRC